MIKQDGVEAYEGSVRYLKAVRDAGLRRAVVSSSANCKDVLVAAGIEDLFEARIDGIVADEQHLKGKPAPDTFLAGARALGVPPAQAAVFEDALAGVQAGRAGEFGYVVGVDRRRGQAEALKQHGADHRGQGSRRAAAHVVIEQPAFPVEPWAVRETELHLDNLAQTESVFALSNGHIGLRGNLDEGEPYGLPGTYLGGFYEVRPLPYAEAGYGYPEDGQTVVNVTNGKIIRLLVEDEPFDVRYGVVRSHERVLDLRDGVLRRTVEWTSPTGRMVRVTSTRLVSFTQRAVAAIEYVVEPLEDSFPVVVQSELVANESGPAASGDPRAAAALASPLESEMHDGVDLRGVLVHHTRTSGLTDGGGDGPPHRRARRHRHQLRGVRRHGSRRRHRRPGAGQAAAHRQAARLRLVGGALGGSAARPGRGRRRRAPSTPAGTACWPSSAPTSTSSGSGPTSRSRATPSCSRRSASACSTRCRRAPAASSGRSRPRASPGRATTATPSGTPRRSCCRCSPTPPPTAPPTRCAGATGRSTWPASGRGRSA